MYGAHDSWLVTTCVVQAQKKWLREFIVQFLPNLLRVVFFKIFLNRIPKSQSIYCLCLLRSFVGSV